MKAYLGRYKDNVDALSRLMKHYLLTRVILFEMLVLVIGTLSVFALTLFFVKILWVAILVAAVFALLYCLVVKWTGLKEDPTDMFLTKFFSILTKKNVVCDRTKLIKRELIQDILETDVSKVVMSKYLLRNHYVTVYGVTAYDTRKRNDGKTVEDKIFDGYLIRAYMSGFDPSFTLQIKPTSKSARMFTDMITSYSNVKLADIPFAIEELNDKFVMKTDELFLLRSEQGQEKVIKYVSSTVEEVWYNLYQEFGTCWLQLKNNELWVAVPHKEGMVGHNDGSWWDVIPYAKTIRSILSFSKVWHNGKRELVDLNTDNLTHSDVSVEKALRTLFVMDSVVGLAYCMQFNYNQTSFVEGVLTRDVLGCIEGFHDELENESENIKELDEIFVEQSKVPKIMRRAKRDAMLEGLV